MTFGPPNLNLALVFTALVLFQACAYGAQTSDLSTMAAPTGSSPTLSSLPGSPSSVSTTQSLVKTRSSSEHGPNAIDMPPPRQEADLDTDDDGVVDDDDNCPRQANPLQVDHDADGTGDRCDRFTYQFTTAPQGQPPMGMPQETMIGSPSLVVRKTAAGVGVRFEEEQMWVVHRFARLSAERRYQDMDITVDVEPSSSGVLGFELWSDGSTVEQAGAGIELTLTASALVAHRRQGYKRRSMGQVRLPSALLPRNIDHTQPLRFRVRLRKGPSITSFLHVDWWMPEGRWSEAGTLKVGDDRMMLGHHVQLIHFGKATSRALLKLTARPVATPGLFSLGRSFAGLDDWKVFQRGPDGHAPIPLHVSWRTTDHTWLEARVLDQKSGAPLPGFDFPDHRWKLEPAPEGQLGSFVLAAVPQGGNYDLHVRMVDAEGGAIRGEDTVHHIGIGDVFLTAGQSNMSGYPLAMNPAEIPSPMAHLFGNDFSWKKAIEPIDDGKRQFDLVSLDFPQHSPQLSFAKHLAESTGVPVAVIPSSNGRTTLYSNWKRDERDPLRRDSYYGSAVSRALAPNFAYPIRGVLWYQGESDYSDHKPAAQYGVHLEQLVHDLRRDLKNPELVFITCQLASFARADIDRWTAYQDVQRRHAARDPRAVLVPTVDLPLNDPVHLNIHGYRRAGRRMAMAALHLIHGQGLAPGPRLRSVHRDPADPNNRIIIAWDRPVTGGQGDLFRLRDGAGKLPVAEVVSSGATTVLTLKRALVGDAILHYGYLKHPQRTSFIQDEAGLAAPVFRDILVSTAP